MNAKVMTVLGLLHSTLCLTGFAWAGGISSGSDAPRPCEEGIGIGYIASYYKVDEHHSCPQRRFTCVVSDSRCPQFDSPANCDGQTMSIPGYLSLGGRLSCSMPQVACVQQKLCPQFAPIPPVCPDGEISMRITGFSPVIGRYSCPQYEAVCVKKELCPVL